ncbi:MAG: CoA-binding protein [Proteobacteria bacterium]|nr:CoA-binding protein [Pseudomonadota bacterium]
MKRTDIEEIFHPRSIAVVGATNELFRGATGFLKCLMDMGFEGRLYPINPRIQESMGLRAYPSLSDVPGPVDHVIVGVPAREAPTIIEDAVEKGVHSVHFFSSGFSELDTREGDALQTEMTSRARGKVRIIGPNCMGLYNPKVKLAFEEGQPAVSGGAGFVSQSGGLATAFVQNAVSEGNYCSKVASIGNSSDLKLTDFLEYLSEDDETETIGLYIEGLGPGEGRAFMDALRAAARRKPVLIWKGGLTDSGARAAFSHTAALAGTGHIWPALVRQFGGILVDSVEEMHDFIKLYRLMPPPASTRSCLVAFGGGCSVTYADLCTWEGIELPALGPDTRQALSEYIAPIGTMTVNPVDVSASGWLPGVLGKTAMAVGADSAVDSVIVISQMVFAGNMSRRMGIDPRKVIEHQAEDVGAAARLMKVPVMCANPAAHEGLEAEDIRLHLKKAMEENGVPSFPDIRRTIKALRRYHDYHRFINQVAALSAEAN